MRVEPGPDGSESLRLSADLSATFRNGKLTILNRGVVREFRSVSEYLDTVALRGGNVPSDVTQALREMERLTRYEASRPQSFRLREEPQGEPERGTSSVTRRGIRHWL
jgi:hypothetical protein